MCTEPCARWKDQIAFVLSCDRCKEALHRGVAQCKTTWRSSRLVTSVRKAVISIDVFCDVLLIEALPLVGLP